MTSQAGVGRAREVQRAVPQIYAVADETPYVIDLDDSPKPEDVDAHAIKYKDLEKKVKDSEQATTDAKAPLLALKLQLIALVRKFGGAHAEKSKLMHGILWELMGTFGQSTTQDAAAIERLRLALVKAKKARLLKKLFTKRVSWQFNSNATTVIKTEKLTDKEKGLVLDCFDTEDSTPRLDVREKKKG
jgi:hypothetical protein